MRPKCFPTPNYEKPLFRRKLDEMGFRGGITDEILDPLPDDFTLHQLGKSISTRQRRAGFRPTHEETRALECIHWLAKSNYEVAFNPKVPLSERIIFPGQRQREQRHRGRAFRAVHRRRWREELLRDLHRVQRQGDPAADPANDRFPELQGQYAQRPRGAQQGHGAVPAQDRRALRDDLAPGRREPVPDVLRQRQLLGGNAAALAADVSVGSSCNWATAVRPSRQKRVGYC